MLSASTNNHKFANTEFEQFYIVKLNRVFRFSSNKKKPKSDQIWGGVVGFYVGLCKKSSGFFGIPRPNSTERLHTDQKIFSLPYCFWRKLIKNPTPWNHSDKPFIRYYRVSNYYTSNIVAWLFPQVWNPKD